MQLNLQGWRPSQGAHGAASIAPFKGIKNPGGSMKLIPRGQSATVPRMRSLRQRYDHAPYCGRCRVNQVEIASIPSRSTFWPPHTHKPTEPDVPSLNCTSLGSWVCTARLYTTRHVGPVQHPPLSEPECSHTPFPNTSWWIWVVRVLNPFALRSSTDPIRNSGSERILPDQMPVLNGPRSEEHTSELQSRLHLVCRLLLEKKKK